MKKNKIIFYCSILLIGFQSCKKDADVKLPNIESKLVVSSFISPQDSLIQVAVSLSTPLYNKPSVSNEYSPLLNAIVKINNGTSSYNLIYNSKLERYVIDSIQLKITAGLTYYLFVKTPDGKNADASTTIPLLNNTLSYTVTKKNTLDEKYTLNGTWIDNDINNINNYGFNVAYTSFFIYSGNNAFGSFSDTIKNWAINSKLFSDAEGSVFRKELEFTYRLGKNDTVFTSLTTLSKEYIDYYSKFNTAYTSFSSPFSEPVQMYTNIRGGFGVFASFNEYKLRVFL